MSALDGVGGVRGWRWLLFVQGVPSVLLGLVAPAVLTDRPEQARWLTPAERRLMRQALDAGSAGGGGGGGGGGGSGRGSGGGGSGGLADRSLLATVRMTLGLSSTWALCLQVRGRGRGS